jgi:P27 family predicted phage terminase small subunit
MRGRRPTPSALKLVDVTHRRANEREPRPTPGAPDAPEWLSPAARAEWDRVAPELARMDLLTHVDMAALAAYCQCYAHYVEAERVIQEHGFTVSIRDDKGVLKAVIPVPEIGIAVKMLDKVRQFANEFGFSPSSRSRIEVPASSTEGKEGLRVRIQEQISRLEKASQRA